MGRITWPVHFAPYGRRPGARSDERPVLSVPVFYHKPTWRPPPRFRTAAVPPVLAAVLEVLSAGEYPI